MWKIKNNRVRGMPSDDDLYFRVARIAIIENEFGQTMSLTSVRLVPGTAPRQSYRMAEEETLKAILAELDRINKAAEPHKPEEKPSPTLKPCPFCGRAATLKKIPGSWGYYPDAVSIGCDACEIKFRADTEEWAPGWGTHTIYDQAVSCLADKWNTRHQELKGGPDVS